MADDLTRAFADLRPDDIRLDHLGRVVITAPSVADRVREIGGIKGDLAARDDTNIICCGNTKCGRSLDLGALAERFSAPSIKG
jgi:hypothetical protein